jgi:hypothetical protein
MAASQKGDPLALGTVFFDLADFSMNCEKNCCWGLN